MAVLKCSMHLVSAVSRQMVFNGFKLVLLLSHHSESSYHICIVIVDCRQAPLMTRLNLNCAQFEACRQCDVLTPYL